MNFLEFNQQFPTELACIEYFIKVRYNNKLICRHCNSDKIYHRKDEPKKFQCSECHNSFSIFKDTIFEKSCTDLRKWMYAIHLFLNSKKGISGYQLQREIGVTYKCAWRMLKQIRLAMGNLESNQFMGTLIKVDATYMGGKPRKGNKKDDDSDDELPKNKRGRGTKKNVVVGCVDRVNKSVFANAIFCAPVAQLFKYTFRYSSQKWYFRLSKMFYAIGSEEFVSKDRTHTNNIENFWGTLKRGILGIYHHLSPQYLQKYVDEFACRFNNRKNRDVFNLLVKQAIL